MDELLQVLQYFYIKNSVIIVFLIKFWGLPLDIDGTPSTDFEAI